MIEAFSQVMDDVATSFSATHPAVAAVRLLIAGLFGAAIGFEREMNHRPAGLRTHILIAMGACLFALVSFEIVELIQTDPGSQTADPLRLIDSVTSGVAFLAAGSIIVSGGKVQGLTTGAGMWMAGAIGLACGVGKIGLAFMAALMVVIILWLLRPVRDKVGELDGKGGD